MSDDDTTTTNGEPDPDERKRATIYLDYRYKDGFQKWLDLLKLNMYPGVDSEIAARDDTQRKEMHEAMVMTAIANSTEFVNNLEKRREDPEKFKDEFERLMKV
jgi:hypothetical protein